MDYGRIYQIKYNIWTHTYFVYRFGKPMQLRRDETKAMKKFMENHTYTKVYGYEVWQ